MNKRVFLIIFTFTALFTVSLVSAQWPYWYPYFDFRGLIYSEVFNFGLLFLLLFTLFFYSLRFVILKEKPELNVVIAAIAAYFATRGVYLYYPGIIAPETAFWYVAIIGGLLGAAVLVYLASKFVKRKEAVYWLIGLAVLAAVGWFLYKAFKEGRIILPEWLGTALGILTVIAAALFVLWILISLIKKLVGLFRPSVEAARRKAEEARRERERREKEEREKKKKFFTTVQRYRRAEDVVRRYRELIDEARRRGKPEEFIRKLEARCAREVRRFEALAEAERRARREEEKAREEVKEARKREEEAKKEVEEVEKAERKKKKADFERIIAQIRKRTSGLQTQIDARKSEIEELERSIANDEKRIGELKARGKSTKLLEDEIEKNRRRIWGLQREIESLIEEIKRGKKDIEKWKIKLKKVE